jgi:hypothetical protein
MYRLHRYWSKKSSDAVADLVDRWSPDGGIVLDPFCGSGVVLGEAVRLRRRAVGIDINPMAVFISRTMLSPVNLSQLADAFECVKSRVASTTDALYATTCAKCGGRGIVDFVTHDIERSVRIGYRCACTKDRLFKEPSRSDLLLEQKLKKSQVPFPYPDHVEIPTIQRERFLFVHELFSRRNLIALSTILHEILNLAQARCRIRCWPPSRVRLTSPADSNLRNSADDRRDLRSAKDGSPYASTPPDTGRK